MRQKEEVGRVVVHILAKGVGAYPGEGAGRLFEEIRYMQFRAISFSR